MKKTLTRILSLALAVLTLCSSFSFAVAEEEPTLKILYNYTTFDMNEDVSGKLVQELTGIKVEWYNLSQGNDYQQLALDISGGMDYDIIFHSAPGSWSEMLAQGMVMDISGLLAQGGQNLTSIGSEMAWDVLTDDSGAIYGIPYEAQLPTNATESAYGMLRMGLAFADKALADIGKEMPTTIEELLDVLRTYKEKTGNVPLTYAASPYIDAIMSAFDLTSGVKWYDKDGAYTPLVKMPELVEYITLVQSMYQEGLIDPDLPTVNSNSSQEKFTNGTALTTNMAYWSIPGVLPALQMLYPDVEVLIAPPFGYSDAETVNLYASMGLTYVNWIPVTSKNPELAIKFLNILADNDTAKRVYIGEEGVHHEVKNGGYYPIQPAFADNHTNSDKYLATIEPAAGFSWAQARARKTDEMAAAYDKLNARIDEYSLIADYASFASSLPEVQEYESSLNTLVSDALLTIIVGTEDVQTAINKLIAEWDAQGGLELEAAMQKFYDENKSSFKF